ncbi:MAG: NAD-glutamate dehydrogenase domain-containing protein [Steroidobacteraceae bacterium]
MLPTIPAARQKIIERIAAAATKHANRSDRTVAEAFTRQYYRGVDEEDLGEYSVEQLALAALGHLQFAKTRKPSRPAVRIFNPDPDSDGWACTHTIVEVTVEDMPFLVDSLNMVLSRAGLRIHLMAHPVIAVRRDRAGRISAVGADDAKDGFVKESWQHIETDRIVDPAAMRAIEAKILSMLDDVQLAVQDWPKMRELAAGLAASFLTQPAPAPAGETGEIRALLEWLAQDHFTFIGYRQYRLQRGRSEDILEPLPETGLGILRPRRGRAESSKSTKTLRGELRDQARDTHPLTITKANSVSTVHRATYLDYLSVKTFDRTGRVTGEHRFLGLFTTGVYHLSPREIPLLRHKIDRVVASFGLDPASHDGKAVMHVLETYPRDELFQASVADLIRIVRAVVNLYERQRVRVLMRRDGFGRFYSILIYVPRDRYNTQVRHKIEAVVRQQLAATDVDSQIQLSDSVLARVHMIVRVPETNAGRVDANQLEEKIADAVLTWDDRLRQQLVESQGETAGVPTAERFSGAFPAAYQDDVSAAMAVDDIAQLEEVIADYDRIVLRLVAGRDSIVHLRLFRSAAPIVLSQALPILENMGFVVLSERPYRITVRGKHDLWLQDFEMRRRDGGSVDPAQLGTRVTDAFLAVWNDRAENDGFNRLVVAAGLTWRQAMVLRAYCRFILQSGVAFSQAYMEQVLASNISITVGLSALFEAQFDPALKPAKRTALIEKLQTQITGLLEAVTSLDEDRILRRFYSSIGASLRTNYYQEDAAGAGSFKPYLSFKLDSRSIPDLPQPRPAFEIFVYSPRVEGVHLRMGYVARGGIRWSDRREDFRTEVLGLMKAQNVKNTLIVPVGAKGGFVPKRLAAGASREDAQREGVESYRTFIRALLDITDNIVDGEIVPPPQVVRRDGDDAYLVVAADKGTASFSDIANRIALEYQFWLGDAFASGGSAGYDHKKMAITARGAWECVKRHFRELGIDTQTQDFTVAGIGDMSGDVFGNGMLLSRHIQLVAAFNHQHILIDPTPDAARSFAERERLFKLPRSTWEDYNQKLISKGGGIYPRSAKSIKLSTQAQALLDIKKESVTPQDLMRAILTMRVDLLWNGGIGTYVKATSESHGEVGDRANDAVRVNGQELRCKVVGEGGNLGFSQRGRVEYALNGGRLNTDFIDNSAGVDCSDHEVNIKILLNSAPRRSRLEEEARNELLVAMTDDVAAHVLRDNYLQSQALSMLEIRAVPELMEHAHTIRSLEVSGQLDRALEFLPSVEEIGARRKAGRGLTRPELAILLAYAKMALYSRLIDSDVPEDPYLGHELERYFPPLLQKRSGRYLGQHRLRREIIATVTTNSMVNRMGATFARRAQEDTGKEAAAVVRAYAIAREAFAMRDTWGDIEALDTKINAQTQYEMMFDTTRLLTFSTYWLLQVSRGKLDIDAQVSRLRSGLKRLDGLLPKVLSGSDLAIFERMHQQFTAAGVPGPLSRRMASLSALRSGPDLVEISEETHLDIETCAIVYFGMGTALSLDWMREQIEGLATEGHWQTVARTTLRDNIYRLQRQLTLLALKGAKTPAQALQPWLERNKEGADHVRQTVKEMRALPATDFATLSVALQSVRRLAE